MKIFVQDAISFGANSIFTSGTDIESPFNHAESARNRKDNKFLVK